jgi:polyphosphate glucokinase
MPSAKASRAGGTESERTAAPAPRTLCVDIGGTGLKALLVDAEGKPATERVRVPTPRPATPQAVLGALASLIEPLGEFERASVGFPGVVVDGVTRAARNLHPTWRDFPLAKAIAEATGRPVKVLNDAGVQGYGVIDGRGVEMLLTLGTGLGCALFVDGIYVPNLELAHHPFRKGQTYEEQVGAIALGRVGKQRWNARVARVVQTVLPVFNPRRLYVGGGNAKLVKVDLPPNVTLTPNIAGLTGGFKLWTHEGGAEVRKGGSGKKR